MASKTIIPPTHTAVTDGNGYLTTPWRRYFDEVDSILGGGTNAITESTNRDAFDSTMHTAFTGDLEKRIKNIEKIDCVSVDTRKQFNAISKSLDYTATNLDYINASNSIKVTLPLNPVKHCVVSIRNNDGSKITIKGNGRNINACSTVTIRRKGTSLDIYYFIDSDEWFIK